MFELVRELMDIYHPTLLVGFRSKLRDLKCIKADKNSGERLAASQGNLGADINNSKQLLKQCQQYE